MTQFIFTVQGLLLVAALWFRPSWLSLALAAAWIGAVGITTAWPDLAHPRVTIPLDLAIMAVGAAIWRANGCELAKITATIGAIKVIFTVFAVVVSLHPHSRAAAINAALMLQCIVAGGLADGFIAWVGRCVWSIRRRLSGTLVHVEAR